MLIRRRVETVGGASGVLAYDNYPPEDGASERVVSMGRRGKKIAGRSMPSRRRTTDVPENVVETRAARRDDRVNIKRYIGIITARRMVGWRGWVGKDGGARARPNGPKD